MEKVRFVYGEPALACGTTLAVTDLHIGIEQELAGKGVRVRSAMDSMQERLLSLVEQEKAERLVIIGDVKHTIPNADAAEELRLKRFLRKLASKTGLVIIPGNHDSRLKELLKWEDFQPYPVGGVAFDGVGYCHGHAWPSEELAQAEVLVMGHSHPGIELVDSFGHKTRERAWLVGEVDEKKFLEKYPEGNKKIRVVIMPAFNPLVGAFPFNKKEDGKLLGPFLKSRTFKLGNAETYMLNGVCLGKLKELKQALESK